METEIQTAGKPYKLELLTDQKVLNSSLRDEDLAFVTVRVVDKEGRLCPDASHLVRFFFFLKGKYKVGANGDPTCLDAFHLPEMHLFNGQMTAIIAETGGSGQIRIKASAKGLKPAELQIQVKEQGQ